MNIVVLRESLPGEARVALMPESVKKLVALKASVSLRAAQAWGRRERMTTTAKRMLKLQLIEKVCWNRRTCWSR